MSLMKFRKELYSKVSLIKAAYNFTDQAYVHLDAHKEYFYVSIEPKHAGCEISEPDFINEMLTQSVRHEVYQQTKNIRELLLARAMASSVIVDEHLVEEDQGNAFTESEIIKDWFAAHEESKI